VKAALRVLGVLCLLVALASCSDDAPSGNGARSPTTIQTFDDLSTRLGCTAIETGDAPIAPIRSGASIRGVSCTIHGSVVHIFDRAQGVNGAMSNIDRVLGVGIATPGCNAEVLITHRYFAVSNDRDLLVGLVADLGAPERPPASASPTVSYLPPDCTLG
jgi:hypothetical protein